MVRCKCENCQTMHFSIWIIVAQICVCLALQEGFYDKNPNIYELNPSNFKKVVHNTNYTTIVEFYAPWCGYCKQLKNAYTKLGKFIQKDSKYAVNVAAVNCDKDENKQLCTSERVSGYPTLKVYRPPKFNPKKESKSKTAHVAEVFSGQRAFKPMVEFLTSRLKNYVKQMFLFSAAETWINQEGTRYKVVLITESPVPSPLYKSLAIDFLGDLEFSFIKVKEALTETSISVGGEKLDLPIKAGEKKPIMLLFDTVEHSVTKFEDGKLNNKLALTEWLRDQTLIEPREGELSKKEKYLSQQRLEKKLKKSKKEKRKPFVKDEL